MANSAAKELTNRNWRENNRDKLNAIYRQRSFVGRFINEMAKAHPCTDCGNRYPSCAMDWDHLPGNVKRDRVSAMYQNKPSTIFAEIVKCELVCANCHRIRTHQRLEEGPRGK